MNAAERRLITYAAFAHALTHTVELTYPALLTRIEEDFGVRAVILGTIASIFSWAFGGSAIPAGFLTDRLGSRRVLFYAFAGATPLPFPARRSAGPTRAKRLTWRVIARYTHFPVGAEANALCPFCLWQD